MHIFYVLLNSTVNLFCNFMVAVLYFEYFKFMYGYVYYCIVKF